MDWNTEMEVRGLRINLGTNSWSVGLWNILHNTSAVFTEPMLEMIPYSVNVTTGLTKIVVI